MKLRQFYLNWFVFVYALYCYFNKGVAYTYLAEITLVIGVLIFIKNYRSISINWDRKTKILLCLLLIDNLYVLRGFKQYGIVDTLRDSFIFNYSCFVWIIFLFKDQFDLFKSKIAQVYKWFPLIVTLGFLLKSFIPFFAEFSLFGEIPFLMYKNGDLGVQLLVATFFLMNGQTKLSKRFAIVNFILIGYLFLIAATYNRGGMLSFIVGLATFLYYVRKTDLAKRYFSYIKFVPVVLFIALPIYLNTKINEKDQERKIGIEQLTQNITSIFNQEAEKTDLNDNVFWRLAWWGKIVDYTFLGPYFLNGKGLGVNLSIDDEIEVEGDKLRSPHNFHLNILARFGVPIFFLWLYWIFLLFKDFKRKNFAADSLMYLSIILAFFINANFDVSMEGPMSALPCWTFIGISFLQEFILNEEVQHAV